MVGPVATVLLGVVLLGEPLTPWVALGTALVLAGVALLARRSPAAPSVASHGDAGARGR